MKARAVSSCTAYDPESVRRVTVFADLAGEYCTWFFGHHNSNLLGSEMDLPYRIDRVLPKSLREADFSPAQKIHQLAKWLLLTHEAHDFEIAPEEWVAAV